MIANTITGSGTVEFKRNAIVSNLRAGIIGISFSRKLTVINRLEVSDQINGGLTTAQWPILEIPPSATATIRAGRIAGFDFFIYGHVELTPTTLWQGRTYIFPGR